MFQRRRFRHRCSTSNRRKTWIWETEWRSLIVHVSVCSVRSSRSILHYSHLRRRSPSPVDVADWRTSVLWRNHASCSGIVTGHWLISRRLWQWMLLPRFIVTTRCSRVLNFVIIRCRCWRMTDESVLRFKQIKRNNMMRFMAASRRVYWRTDESWWYGQIGLHSTVMSAVRQAIEQEKPFMKLHTVFRHF